MKLNSVVLWTRPPNSHAYHESWRRIEHLVATLAVTLMMRDANTSGLAVEVVE